MASSVVGPTAVFSSPETPGRRTHPLVMVGKLLVAGLLVMDALDNATLVLGESARLFGVEPHWVPMLLAVVFTGSAVLSLFRPRLAALIGVAPLVLLAIAHLDWIQLLGGPLIVSAVMTVIGAGPALIAVHGLVQALVVGQLAVWRSMPGFLAIIALAWVFALLTRLHLRRRAIAATELGRRRRDLAKVAAQERDALAGELSAMLLGGLDRQRQLIDAAATSTDPPEVAGLLARLRTAILADLGRLRMLVTTLHQGPGQRLREIIEQTEDDLVWHGHTVEVDIPHDLSGVDSVVVDALATALASAREHVLVHASAASGCSITVTVDGTLVRLSVQHPECDLEPNVQDTCALTTVVSVIGSSPSSRGRFPGGLRLGRWLVTLLGLVGATVNVVATVRALDAATDPWPSALWCLGFAAIALSGWWPGLATVLLLIGLPVANLTLTDRLESTSADLMLMTLMALLVAKRLWWGAVCWVGWVLYLVVWPYQFSGLVQQLWLDLAFMPAVGLAAGLFLHHGDAVSRMQRAELVRLEQAEFEARQAERRALATELHDMVAHQLSQMQLEAAADASGPLDLAAARGRVARLAELHDSACDELQALVAMMSPTGDRHGVIAAPTPEVSALSVSDMLDRAGHPTTVLIDVAEGVADDTMQRTVARILRESGTNIVRYAEPGGECTIDVRVRGRRLQVVVTSPLALRSRHDKNSSRLGLLGLAERVDLTGGTFETRAVDQVWEVRASIPLHVPAKPVADLIQVDSALGSTTPN